MFYEKILRCYSVVFLLIIHYIRLSNCQLTSSLGGYRLCVDGRQIPDRVCLALQKGNSQVSCVLVEDSVDCAIKIQNGEADFGLFTAEEALLVFNFINQDVEVIGQLRHREKLNESFAFQTVAVVKSSFNGDFANLQGKNYCHPGFEAGQTWTDRVLKEFENNVIPRVHRAKHSTVDNELYSISRFFNAACRPGRWSMDELMDNKLKQQYSSLCQLCDFHDQCTYTNEMHGSHKSALNCLTNLGGDIAYVSLQYVREYFGLIRGYEPHANATDYKFLCPSGQTSPLNASCSWLKQPWPSVVASRGKSFILRSLILQWLSKDSSGRGNWEEVFRSIIEGPDFVFQTIPGPKTLLSYVEEGRKVPLGWDDDLHRNVKMCVPDQKYALEKCNWLKQSVITHGIEPELSCQKADNVTQCFEFVQNKSSDIVNVDTEYGFLGRKLYNLSTVVYEDGASPNGNYLIVAVIKNNAGNITSIDSLKNKKACFPSYNGLAWLSVINVLRTILPKKCPYDEALASFFSQLCAPSLTGNHNKSASSYYCNLCEEKNNISQGGSFKPNGVNKYRTDIGALSCLTERGADVAFVDYYLTFADSNKLFSHNIPANNLKILCKNGTLLEDFRVDEDCAFAYGSRAEILSRTSRSKIEQIDYTELLLKMDDWMGGTRNTYSNVMDLYAPFNGTKNVLFKESTLNIVPIYDHNYNYIESYSELQKSANEICIRSSSQASITSAHATVALLGPIVLLFLISTAVE